MTIVRSSLLFRLLASLGVLLSQGWRGSLVGRFFASLGKVLRSLGRGSRALSFVCREGTLPRVWPESLTCRVCTGLLNLPCALVKWLCRVLRPLLDGSRLFPPLSSLGEPALFSWGSLCS